MLYGALHCWSEFFCWTTDTSCFKSGLYFIAFEMRRMQQLLSSVNLFLMSYLMNFMIENNISKDIESI